MPYHFMEQLTILLKLQQHQIEFDIIASLLAESLLYDY